MYSFPSRPEQPSSPVHSLLCFFLVQHTSCALGASHKPARHAKEFRCMSIGGAEKCGVTHRLTYITPNWQNRFYHAFHLEVRATDSACVFLTERTMIRTWSAPMASQNARRLCNREAGGGHPQRCCICCQQSLFGWWRVPPSPALTNGYLQFTTSGTLCCCLRFTCWQP